jgi:hypothetical protein
MAREKGKLDSKYWYTQLVICKPLHKPKCLYKSFPYRCQFQQVILFVTILNKIIPEFWLLTAFIVQLA